MKHQNTYTNKGMMLICIIKYFVKKIIKKVILLSMHGQAYLYCYLNVYETT